MLPVDLGDYRNGSIQRVDLRTGRVDVIYDNIDGQPLSSPNDLVFDVTGGFWFTDWGKPRERSNDKGALCFGMFDGSRIAEVVFPLANPNGVALSPDGSRVYVSESHCGRVLVGELAGPGRIHADPEKAVTGVPVLDLLGAPGGNTGFDSMKAEADGSVCVATVGKGGITRITADGTVVEHTPLDDWLTTNLAFGGTDMRTCFVTLSARGQLAAINWPRPGLPLEFSR
jgi:gluconolactonase